MARIDESNYLKGQNGFELEPSGAPAWVLVGGPNRCIRRGIFRGRYRDPGAIYPLPLRSLIHSQRLPLDVSGIPVGADLRRARGVHPLLRGR